MNERKLKTIEKILKIMLIPAFIAVIAFSIIIASVLIEYNYQNQIFEATNGRVGSIFCTQNLTIQVTLDQLQTLDSSNLFYTPHQHNTNGTMTIKTLILREQIIVEGLLLSGDLSFGYFFEYQGSEIPVPFEVSERSEYYDYDQFQTTLSWTTTIQCSDIAEIYGITIPFWL